MLDPRIGIESIYPAQCRSFLDAAAGAEYWGEVALMEIQLVGSGIYPDVTAESCGARAAIAAHFGFIAIAAKVQGC